MNEFRYILDPGSKKFTCPSCEKKDFVRYIDSHVNNYIEIEYGRCDREQKCGYHLNPYKCSSFITHRNMNVNTPKPKPKPKFIPPELFQKSKGRYQENSFVQYLLSLFDKETVKKLIDTYHIGTSSKLKGGCIFYQIDLKGNIRRGKIMMYDASTGKRLKSKGSINSVHNQLGIDKECYPEWRFFGEHLLTNSKPVALVEAEKTAIIASAYFPDYNWIATGTKSTLKKEYAKCLKGKSVTLFPDQGAFSEWQEKTDELKQICKVNISDLLEHGAPKGYDIADYLTGFDLSDFTGRVTPALKKDRGSQGSQVSHYPADWDEVTLSADDPEYDEYSRIALSDCDNDYERAKILDPMLQTIETMFDAVPEST